MVTKVGTDERARDTVAETVIQVLIVEDNRADARLIQALLADVPHHPFVFDHMATLGTALAQLQRRTYDAVLLDLSLPDSKGLDTLRAVSRQAPQVACVVVSGLDDEDVALNAVKEGAQDYLVKDHMEGQLLAHALRYAVERKKVESALAASELRFRQVAENINEVFWVIESDDFSVSYVSPAYERVWGRRCQELYEHRETWITAVHDEDRPRVEKAFERLLAGHGYSQEYRVVQPDGNVRWVWDRGGPARDDAGRIVRLVGIAEDVTDRKQLERAITDVATREHERMGQELHDSIGQVLTGLSLMSQGLRKTLEARALPEAEIASRIHDAAKAAARSVRQLVRGMWPVDVCGDGIVTALREMADLAGTQHEVDCDFESRGEIALADNAIALQILRIAQEAVANAIKHSGADHIHVSLEAADGAVILEVSDDGRGFAGHGPKDSGMGLRIMRCRAGTIGAILDIQSAPGAGTRVTCRVRT
ncbi:MAG: hypothetical protein CMJ18_26430 [Phycisphaeraceae bacterium]|nr:hypothetical protein [Phycisphaeraceae bacterium]